MSSIVDNDGYRKNVGIVIINDVGQVLLARRHSGYRWQFPQGGIDHNETEEDTLYRELKEEVGLDACHVEVVYKSEFWYSYKLPPKFLRPRVPGRTQCIGQKQRWFLLRMKGDESNICLDGQAQPEFSEWGWFEPSLSISSAIYFKKSIYQKVIDEFTPHLY